jgi:hypothetical protein
MQVVRLLQRGTEKAKGEGTCTVLYSCVAYVTSQQGTVSEVHHWQSLVRWDLPMLRVQKKAIHSSESLATAYKTTW